MKGPPPPVTLPSLILHSSKTRSVRHPSFPVAVMPHTLPVHCYKRATFAYCHTFNSCAQFILQWNAKQMFIWQYSTCKTRGSRKSVFSIHLLNRYNWMSPINRKHVRIQSEVGWCFRCGTGDAMQPWMISASRLEHPVSSSWHLDLYISILLLNQILL